MGQSAIVYATLTGHSKNIAGAMGQALGIRAENAAARPVLGNIDLLFIVGGIYGGNSLPALLNFVKTVDAQSVKKAALVTSSARGQKQDRIRELLQNKGVEVLDEFNCPGSFLCLSFGHPNEMDLQQAVDFAVKISAKAGEQA